MAGQGRAGQAGGILLLIYPKDQNMLKCQHFIDVKEEVLLALRSITTAWPTSI